MRPMLSELQEEFLVICCHIIYDLRNGVSLIQLLNKDLVIILDLVTSEHLQPGKDVFILVLIEYLRHQVAQRAQAGLRAPQQLWLLMKDPLILL